MWRIKDWNKHFEVSQSRRCPKVMHWVPVPNKQDGDGYTELLDHPNGAAHFGAWTAIVQLASKCKPRGTLARDGSCEHDIQSLARITRIRSEIYEEAIPRILKIGWLEEVSLSVLGDQSECATTTGQDRTGQDITPAGRKGGGRICESWDSENWQTALMLATTAVRKLWPHRKSRLNPEDRLLIGKAAYLAVTHLSEAWFQDALDETVRAKNTRKPIALFKACLWKRPRADGIDLNVMLDAIIMPEPPEGSKSESAT